MTNSFGAQIKALRSDLGLTQEELAKELGLSTASVKDWEQGRTYPTELNLEELEKLMRVPLFKAYYKCKYKELGEKILSVIAEHFMEKRNQYAMSVYFVQNPRTGHIKIGITNNVKARLTNLQTACCAQLNLLKAIPGGNKKENEIHKRFDHLRVSGEWFKPHKDLIEYINELEGE